MCGVLRGENLLIVLVHLGDIIVDLVSQLIANRQTGADHIAGTRGDGYLFVYRGSGQRFTILLGRISGA